MTNAFTVGSNFQKESTKIFIRDFKVGDIVKHKPSGRYFNIVKVNQKSINGTYPGCKFRYARLQKEDCIYIII